MIINANKYLRYWMFLIVFMITLVSCSKDNENYPKPAVKLTTQAQKKFNVKFNEVIYNNVYHQFIAVGEKNGKPLLITSADGIKWNQHVIQDIGIITSLIDSKNGILYYDLEPPHSISNSIYRINDLNDYILSAQLEDQYSRYESIVKSVDNSHSIYQLRTIGNGIFRVYRITVPESQNTVSSPVLIYTGKNVTDIACKDDDSEVFLTLNNKKTLFTRTPFLPNSFVTMQSATTESTIFTETIAGGVHIVLKVRQKEKHKQAVEIYYSFNEKTNKWEELYKTNSTNIAQDEFAYDADLNYANDQFVDINRLKNNIPQIIIGSVTNTNKFMIESYPDQLPVIAKRTCAAGGIINGEQILVLLGDDNKILRSKDNKHWKVITLFDNQVSTEAN